MSSSPKPEGDDVQQTPPEDQTENTKPSVQGEGPMDDHEVEVKEQDRWLPIANVARIMKSALPDNAKIAKEAKECMQECVSEFISFITSEASEKCQQEKRKTVNGEDILFAMTSLGFENYSEALKIYLARYRESFVQNQKSGGGGAGTAAGANAATGAYPAESTDLGLGADVDGAEGDSSGLNYAHNGNGTVDY